MMADAVRLAFVLVLASALPVFAEDQGRYSLVPAGEGFLRLDTKTGALSLCSRGSTGWTCDRVPDNASQGPAESDRDSSLDTDTAQLRDRLAKAEADLASAKAANEELAARADAAEKEAKEAKRDADAAQPHSPQLTVPQRAVDEFSEILGKLMRRLQEMARDLQRDQSERAL